MSYLKKAYSFAVNLLYRILARCFYSKKWCDYNKLSARQLVALGFMQRIVGFNRGIPWPVHHSSVVTGFDRLKLTTLPPYPGLGVGQYIQSINGIEIGEYVRMAPGVKLISADHDVNDYEKHLSAPPIRIGDYCWLGANAVLLPGVQLGKHVVVAAGAIVTKSFDEDNVVLAGVPARVVKKLAEYSGTIPDKTIYVERA
jgi:acetyltransferase-like isoleucine patch superfamily enzyme